MQPAGEGQTMARLTQALIHCLQHVYAWPQAEEARHMPRRPPESEAGFQAAVLDAAVLCGWAHYHTHDSRRSPSGFPDLVLARPGDAVLFIELKTNQGQIRPPQRYWMRVLSLAIGCEYYVWRPRMWESIAARLQRPIPQPPKETPWPNT